MPHAENEITAELSEIWCVTSTPTSPITRYVWARVAGTIKLWRLGDDLAVRLPWATRDSDALLRKEHTWVPMLAPRLPLPVPVPQRIGEPSERFPRPWLITTWVPGTPAARTPVTRAADAAESLATFPDGSSPTYPPPTARPPAATAAPRWPTEPRGSPRVSPPLPSEG